MNSFLALSTLTMSLIIVGASLLFIGIVILLYFLIVRNRALTRQVKELNRRYEYLHSLLNGQDMQYLKRIEYIAQVNLLYGPIHEKYLNKLRLILNGNDQELAYRMREFRDNISAKRYGSVRKSLPNFRKEMNVYEDEVKNITDELAKIIRPEEECNRLILGAKENYQLIKQEYIAHKTELAILKKSYEASFKYIDNLFNQFHTFVEEANYEEATNLMPSINKVLTEIDEINRAMPQLCALVSHTLPQKISDFENEYKRIAAEACPVQHIVTPKIITQMREEVRKIARELKNFIYKDALERLNHISTHIDTCIAQFMKEKEARKQFESEVDDVYSRVGAIEKNFIRLCNSIPKIRKVYIISDDKVVKRRDINSKISRLGIAKRSLDTFIHSASTKQPYSLLLKKMIELKNGASEIENELKEFSAYLASLKVDVENAYGLVSTFYYRIRRAEKFIRDASIVNFQLKYQEKVNNIYKQLEIINKASLALPINVEEIKSAVSFINFEGESTLNQIEQDYNMMKLAESALIFVNKDRRKYADLNKIVIQNEKRFYEGDFERVYNEITEAIKTCRELEKR